MKKRNILLLILAGVFCTLISSAFLAMPSAHAQETQLSAAELMGVASSGGSLQLDGTKYSAAELMGIASSASNSSANKGFTQVRVTLVNVRKLSGAEMMGIASSGKGCVTFILDK